MPTAAPAPVFLLAPARSNGTVVTAMLGQHAALYGFPELALFRADTVGGLLDLPARIRLDGLVRALAELQDGSPAAAVDWLEERRAWPAARVYEHLLGLVAPRAGVQKSPEDSDTDERLARLAAAFPAARLIHLARHPVTSAASMHRLWSPRGSIPGPPGERHAFCLRLWAAQHERIARLGGRLVVRSEDVLNRPATELPRICAWLGMAPDLAAMAHPERSPYARPGPEGARGGGGDPGFLADPRPHPVEEPAGVEIPAGWAIDPVLAARVQRVAQALGY